MALARLLLFSLATYPEEHKTKTAEVLSHFLSVAKAQEITNLEEKYTYNWITMLPFIEMLYTAVSSDKLHRNAMVEPPAAGESQQWSVCVAVVALEAEMGRKCNRELVVRQGLLDFIVCLPWGVPQWPRSSVNHPRHYVNQPRSSMNHPRHCMNLSRSCVILPRIVPESLLNHSRSLPRSCW